MLNLKYFMSIILIAHSFQIAQMVGVGPHIIDNYLKLFKKSEMTNVQ